MQFPIVETLQVLLAVLNPIKLFVTEILFVLSAFVRDDGLPLASVPKYTWHITNLMQVKHIFDTPEVNMVPLSLLAEQLQLLYL